jgi:alpha-L-rhamnosidase
MTRFMDWRKRSAPEGQGMSLGNTWGDWLNLGETTPIEFIDAVYFALDAQLMAQMAAAIGRNDESTQYRELQARVVARFAQDYVTADGTLKVDTQTAHVLALAFGLLPEPLRQPIANRLAERIAEKGYRMATGFLGTKPLLTVLTAHGQNDLACRLFQSRQFPSWGYEVVNGATTVWERWDSFTKEHGFNGLSGNQNASMNSFSHYSFGAVMEWAFRDLAGIDTEGPGFRHIVIRPNPPTPGSNPDLEAVHWVKAEYESVRGRIVSRWRSMAGGFQLDVNVPANTSATVLLPARPGDLIQESHQPLHRARGVRRVQRERNRAVLQVESGRYRFLVAHAERSEAGYRWSERPTNPPAN